MSATAAMRNLIDAGQFSNLPGGFKAKGVRIVGDNDPIAPGEFKEVEATGMDLNKSIVPLPYKEPSGTLVPNVAVCIWRRSEVCRHNRTGN